MNNIEFAEKAKEIATKYNTLYVLGCFGAPLNSTNKKRYTNNYAYNGRSIRKNKIINASSDTFGFDCVCLIKGLLWGWNGDINHVYGGAKYDSNGIPDYNADQMIKQCTFLSSDFSKIEIGEVVHIPGHIGIYVGDGLVVECTPIWKDGVQLTALLNIGKKQGYNGRIWNEYGKLKYIEYINVTSNVNKKTIEELAKERCPNSKSFRETVIKKAFIDGYRILCNTDKENIDNLFKDVTKYINENDYFTKIEKLENQVKTFESKKKTLLDFLIEQTIDKVSYNEKKEQYDKKINNLKHEIEQYKLLLEDDNKVENGIKKIKNMIKEHNILDDFDEEVFKALVDYCIIGGFENGKIEEYMIRFICKTKFNFTVRNNITIDKILSNNNIVNSETKEYITILDFYSIQDYYVFIRGHNNKLQKFLKNKIRVRFEIEK